MTGIFVPYLMLDVVNLINSDHLSKIDFRHKERKYYTELFGLYQKLNSLFFSGLTQEQTDAIIDMMDAFGEYIYNEVEIFRLNIISVIMELEDNFRTNCGTLCCCKLMISQAKRAWDNMCRREFQVDDRDNVAFYLNAMEHRMTELMNTYFLRDDRLTEDLNLSTVTKVRKAEEAVVRKILKFLKEYDNSNRN